MFRNACTFKNKIMFHHLSRDYKFAVVLLGDHWVLARMSTCTQLPG